MIVIFILIIILILSIILFIKYKIFSNLILTNFKTCNVLVSGKKRRGKDLLFQWVINKRDDFYYTNLPKQGYGGEHKTITLKQVSCEPNDYDKIVNDNIEKTKHMFYEGKDIYISDIGVFLPSYMDSKLYVKFPSMPVFYALSGHLYANNVHCNTQNIERGWKALREQADFFIIIRRTIKIFGIFITFMTAYDKYESARKDLRPIKTRFLNKYSKAQVDLYKSTNGLIQNGFIVQFKHNLKYDTRAFEKILLKGSRKIR